MTNYGRNVRTVGPGGELDSGGSRECFWGGAEYNLGNLLLDQDIQIGSGDVLRGEVGSGGRCTGGAVDRSLEPT